MAVLGSLNPFGSLGGLFGGLGLSDGPPPAPAFEGLRSAIYQRLSTDSAITGVVGSRVHPNVRPQRDPYPSLTFDVAGTSKPYGLTGPTFLRQSRFRVSCWARDGVGAEDLAELVLGRLESWQSPNVLGCFLQNTFDMPVDPTGGADTAVYRIVLDFSITYASGAN